MLIDEIEVIGASLSFKCLTLKIDDIETTFKTIMDAESSVRQLYSMTESRYKTVYSSITHKESFKIFFKWELERFSTILISLLIIISWNIWVKPMNNSIIIMNVTQPTTINTHFFIMIVFKE